MTEPIVTLDRSTVGLIVGVLVGVLDPVVGELAAVVGTVGVGLVFAFGDPPHPVKVRTNAMPAMAAARVLMLRKVDLSPGSRLKK